MRHFSPLKTVLFKKLEAVISSADADSLVADAESKWQELSDAKILVDDAIGQLRSENFKFSINLVFYLYIEYISLFDQIFLLRCY